MVHNFQGDKKAGNYEEMVEELLLNLLHNNLDAEWVPRFTIYSHMCELPDNLRNVSEEQGEVFHQDIKVMEEDYQARPDGAQTWWRITVGTWRKTFQKLYIVDRLRKGSSYTYL